MQNETFPKNNKPPTPNDIPVSACGCDTDHHNGVFISTEYHDKRIFFCAQDCKDEFNEDPETFLASDHFVLDFDTLEDV